jgi:type VI secretion system secreted protein VgrG
MYITPSDLSLSLKTASLRDLLIIDRLRMVESISAPFVIELDLHSLHPDISFDEVMGQELLVAFTYESQTRYFGGIVGEFAQGITVNPDSHNRVDLTRYTAKLYPPFWLLKFSQDHQIFQEKSAIEIINSVLEANGVDQKEDQTLLCGQTSLEYCVQYRESYFDYVSRLMEAEGIFYHFDHSQDGEKMILCDDSLKASSAYTELPMTSAAVQEPYFDQIQRLTYARQIVPNQFQTADYNFEMASTTLFSTADGDGKGTTVYRYPGYYQANDVGDRLATNRIQELEWRQEMISGTSTAPLLTPMQSFTVSGHPRDDLNKSFVVYKVVHEIDMLAQPGEQIYKNTFEAFPTTTPFRAPLVTSKPTIASTQTAIVTGKADEEIWCDTYGRIKVKFHWDQKSPTDETSSCWIRVAQLWAGSGWGGLWTPRVGMEVVVTFLEGDPDRPLITGCVYNSDNVPPYAQDDPTKSTIRSNSSKGGDGFNEIRFEDQKGSEEIYIHAQKDMDTVVEDNRTLVINDGNDTADIMRGSRTVTLHGVEDEDTPQNGGNHTLILTNGDNTITLTKGNMTTTLAEGNDSLKVTGQRTITVSEDESHTNSANFNHQVTGNYELAVTGNLSITVSGNLTVSTDGSISFESGGDFTISSSGDIKLSSLGGTEITATGEFQGTGSQVTLTGLTGGSFDGGPSLSLTALGQATLSSAGTTQVLGSNVILG